MKAVKLVHTLLLEDQSTIHYITTEYTIHYITTSYLSGRVLEIAVYIYSKTKSYYMTLTGLPIYMDPHAVD